MSKTDKTTTTAEEREEAAQTTKNRVKEVLKSPWAGRLGWFAAGAAVGVGGTLLVQRSSVSVQGLNAPSPGAELDPGM